MKVSLITTVKDAELAVEPFLASVRAQSRAPDEVVVVDGGSADGTVAALRRHPDLVLVEEHRANIAMGRNVAIKTAVHDVIAVTDGDCILHPEWLARVVAPVEDGAAVGMGFTRPAPRSFLEACVAAAHLPDAGEVDPAHFMPSARSVAFRRSAIEAVGGYPEWLDIGEDMWVDHRWRELGLDMRFVPDAVVYWHPRPDLAGLWRQFAGYAEGDARAGMYPGRHLIRAGAYAAGALAWASGRPGARAVVAAAGLWYARRPLRRAWRRLAGRPRERAAALAAVPAVMAVSDAAKLWGYVRGLTAPIRPRR